MSEIRFHITAERIEAITVDELAAIQDAAEGQGRMRETRSLLAKFVINGDGQYLEEKAALKRIGALTLKEMNAATVEFVKAIDEFTLPKANGDLSSSPSRPAADASPVG